MKLVPNAVTRLAGRSALKINANSPTILVVAGVVGFGATVVMAARATRKIDPVLEHHHKDRAQLATINYADKRAEQREVVRLYAGTSVELAKIYAPTIILGSLSAAAVLSGHRILKGRYVGAMAAYTGLFDQFKSYRARVADVIGTDRERDLYDGAKLQWEEDPEHKGEYKLKTKFDEEKQAASYLRPWFDETNPNYTRIPEWNYMFLKGVQQHINHRLEAYGHVFLNDVYDALGIPRTREGQIAGWLRSDKEGSKDGYVDFGFMTGNEPHTIAFRNKAESTVRLNFNIDGMIFNLI